MAFNEYLKEALGRDRDWKDDEMEIGRTFKWRKEIQDSGDIVVKVSRDVPNPQGRYLEFVFDTSHKPMEEREVRWGYTPTEMPKKFAIRKLREMGENPEEVEFEEVPTHAM